MDGSTPSAVDLDRAEDVPSTALDSQAPLSKRLAGMAFLAAVAVWGGIREVNTAALTSPLRDGLGAPGELQTIVTAAQRLGARFSENNARAEAGQAAVGPSWLLRGPADGLVLGGACGQAVHAMGAVFDGHRQVFRIVLVNVMDHGGSHVMMEAQLSNGKWVLLDPLFGRVFVHPRTGVPLSLTDIQQLPENNRSWLVKDYLPSGDWSLFAHSEISTWQPAARLFKTLGIYPPRAWMAWARPKSRFIEPGGELAALSLLGIAAMLPGTLRILRRKRA